MLTTDTIDLDTNEATADDISISNDQLEQESNAKPQTLRVQSFKIVNCNRSNQNIILLIQ